MIESHYEVNVALKRHLEDKYGVHFCRIVLPTSLTKAEAIDRAQSIRDKFNIGAQSFNVTMTWVECHGEEIAI